MENVLLGVAVALFIIGAVLAVVAGVIFVRRNVMDSIRFLQGKRMGVGASSAGKSSTRRSRRGKGRSPRVAANDRTTDVAGAGPGDDSPTSVVSAGQERGDDRPTTIAGAVVSRAAVGDAPQTRYEDSELPTEILTELDASEQPTGVLSDDAQVEEDSERPTGVLTEEEDSERPTGVLTDGGDEEDASECPTGVLSEEPGDEAEAPTTVLAADADEPSEAPTGVLAIEEDEESESATTVLADAEDEESEMPTTVLGTGEAAESSEQPTSVLEGSEPVEEPLVVEEYDERDGVVQQEESTFRFILKQNVMVIHTEESLD